MVKKQFDNNLSPSLLIMNGIVTFQTEDNSFISFKFPTIRDYFEDQKFSFFITLLSFDLAHLNKMGIGFKAETRGQALIGLLRIPTYREEIGQYFTKYILNSKLSETGIEVEEREMKHDELDFLIDCIFISMGLKDINEVQISEEQQKEIEEYKKMSDLEKKMYDKQKATLEKLKKAKEKKSGKSQINYTQEKVIAAVMQEFKMNLEDIKNINYYTLYWLFGLTFKIDHYAFMQRAAASGNLAKKAKIEHWLK